MLAGREECNLHEETSLSASTIADDDEFATDLRHLEEESTKTARREEGDEACGGIEGKAGDGKAESGGGNKVRCSLQA